MWQSHVSHRRQGCAAGVEEPVLGFCRGAGAEARPLHPPSPHEHSVSPPRSLYIFISQNEDKFPFLEGVEWQIPYSDIFSDHPGGFVVWTKSRLFLVWDCSEWQPGEFQSKFTQHEVICILRCWCFAMDTPAFMNPFAVTYLSVLLLYLILQITVCLVMAKGFQA